MNDYLTIMQELDSEDFVKNKSTGLKLKTNIETKKVNINNKIQILENNATTGRRRRGTNSNLFIGPSIPFDTRLRISTNWPMQITTFLSICVSGRAL